MGGNQYRFFTGVPLSPNQFDSIWVIMHRMAKFAHFLLVRTNFLTEDYARLYLYEIVKLDGVHNLTISNHGMHFSSHLKRFFQKILGTKVS